MERGDRFNTFVIREDGTVREEEVVYNGENCSPSFSPTASGWHYPYETRCFNTKSLRDGLEQRLCVVEDEISRLQRKHKNIRLELLKVDRELNEN